MKLLFASDSKLTTRLFTSIIVNIHCLGTK
jgi:hypothetical protein